MRFIVVSGIIAFIIFGGCTKKLPPLEEPINPPCDTCNIDALVVACSDTGATGYFPSTVGSWWAYRVIKGNTLTSDSNQVADTINMWAETTRVVNDTTWINTYYGGPYSGFQDTFYVFIRGDTIYLNVKYNFKPPTDTNTIPINIKAPFGIYPLIYPRSWDTPWDTLPPANYINGPAADTIAYKLSANVINDTIILNVGSESLCSQKVKYIIHLRIIYTDGYGSGATLQLPSFMFWIPYKGIGRRLEIDFRDTTGGFPTRWLQKDLEGYNILP